MSYFKKFFYRELLLQIRQMRFLVNSCLFFIMILFIFPLTFKPDPVLLKTIVSGLVWMALLLSLLISSERIFQHDFEQGLIEQWLVSDCSMSFIVVAKVMAHWLINIIPIIILCPLIAIVFSLSLWEMTVLIASLLCGTPALLSLCALASSFGIGINQKGALMALILLPLTLPILIFGSGTLNLAMQDLPISGNCALLLAFSILSISLLPLAIASVIRINHSS